MTSKIIRLLPLAVSLSLGAVLVVPNAQAASCKIPKSYYKNVSCTSDSKYFLAVKDFGAPVALIDSNGKKIVDLSSYQRVDANKIAGGLIPVQRNSRVGYVNMQGREVVPTRYDLLKDAGSWARAVSDGRIIVQRNGEYGVISTSNEIIIPFSAKIDDIDDYKNGVAQVTQNKNVSLFDKNGKMKQQPESSGNSNSQANTQAKSTSKDSEAAQSGKLAPTMPQFKAFTTLQPSQQDGKWGFVDEQNITMITYSFDEVKPFSEGLAGVRLGNKWGFVNLGGELVIPFSYDDAIAANKSAAQTPAFIFENNKAWVSSLQNGTKMCIDKKGNSVGCG